jgi:hypothetical protein
MSSSEPPESDLLTPDEMLDTLRREVIAISRAADMQIREITVIVTEYARGKLSPEEANKHLSRYSDRWHDPMYGISSFEGRTDEEILKEMAHEYKRTYVPLYTRPDAPRSRKIESPPR